MEGIEGLSGGGSGGWGYSRGRIGTVNRPRIIILSRLRLVKRELASR